MPTKHFKAQNTFDKVFEVGIILKGLNGLAETISGIFLLLINPETVSSFINWLTHSELTSDPHDFISNHLVHWSRDISKGSLVFLGIYLLAHGVAKLILVIEILRERLWAYIGLIVLTIFFIIYQTYEIIFSHSIGMILLTMFDIVIVYLTFVEYGRQKIVLGKIKSE
jgi:uncharacterized membrane protein